MKTSLWIIIGIVVIALLAALAFALQGDEADIPTATTTPPAVSESMTEADLAQVRAEAVTDLAALRARIEAGETYEELENEYAVIRARVTSAYLNADEAASDEWQDIQAGFDRFEASVRASGSAALDSFADLIATFSADVGTDSPAE